MFGKRTQVRVWEFQNDRGLAPDGIVGPRTYGAILRSGIPNGVHPGYFGAFVIEYFRLSGRVFLPLYMQQIVLTKWVPNPPERGVLGRFYR